ncbi:MAG: biopolymer transporter ExbD [Myxococcota bacterium]
MAGTLSGGGRGRGVIVGINVTPMVDVVLVLLVIMMVSATYIASQSMKVDLPKAAHGDPGTSSPAIVTIAADGALRWNDAAVTEAALTERLRSAAADNPDVDVAVTADRAAAHGVVVHVLDLAKAEGITHFAIGVEQAD